MGTGVDGYSVAWGGAAVAADTTKDLGANVASFTSPAQPSGDRYVALRTVDEAGNWAGQIVAGPFRVDTAVPDDAQVDAPGSPFTWSTSDPVSWNGGADAGSGLVGFDVRSRAAGAKADFRASEDWLNRTVATDDPFVGKPGSTRCFSVRSADLVANRTAWSDEACTAVPLDERAFGAKGAWTQQSGGSFQDTLTTTKARGATLTMKHLQARRFAVMATTCPTCGVFRVLVARHGAGEGRPARCGRSVRRGVRAGVEGVSEGRDAGDRSDQSSQAGHDRCRRRDTRVEALLARLDSNQD